MSANLLKYFRHTPWPGVDDEDELGPVSLPQDSEWSYGGPSTDMVSRRRILSMSRENLDHYLEEEDDVWLQKDRLKKDHILEVLSKWPSIDDSIWGKIIVMERNRRVGKAYARVPVLTVNGSNMDFDGNTIGLNGFDNPLRDHRVKEVKNRIGDGAKLKMNNHGSIFVKRCSKNNVYVMDTTEENAICNDILKLPKGALELEKGTMVFDINKFTQNIGRELKRSYPDRRKLEIQCIVSLAFVKDEPDALQCPVWVMIINIIALEMLKRRLPPLKRVDLRPRIPIPDEDPYSVAGSGSSGSSGNGRRTDRPPKLPPRDHQRSSVPKPDYEYVDDENRPGYAPSRQRDRNDRKYDDPYYCGLRARIPNFAKPKPTHDPRDPRDARTARLYPPPTQHNTSRNALVHTKSYESGMAALSRNQQLGIHRMYRQPSNDIGNAHESEWENLWD